VWWHRLVILSLLRLSLNWFLSLSPDCGIQKGPVLKKEIKATKTVLLFKKKYEYLTKP
jgi:hypothetical protein